MAHVEPPDAHDPHAVGGACRVADVRHFGRYALVSLLAGEVAERARAGQFVMVGVPGPEFHLRRPLSVHSVSGDTLKLLIEPRGTGSRALCAVGVADVLEVVGPLGRPFPVVAGRAVVLGGGIGVAPLQLLVDELTSVGAATTVVFGFRDAGQARLVTPFEIDELWVATEDGSLGRRGTAVDVAREMAVQDDSVVYACGPTPMLTAVQGWARARGLRGHVSLEAHMACGSGSCQGCVVATREGYRRVCADGPVFDLEELEAPA